MEYKVCLWQEMYLDGMKCVFIARNVSWWNEKYIYGKKCVLVE